MNRNARPACPTRHTHDTCPTVTTGSALTVVLTVVLTLTLCLAGCGKGPADAPGVSATPPPPAKTAQASVPAPASILGEMPAKPTPSETVVPGAPMPQMTTEMMLQFESRFGRPPSNYKELRRMSEPGGKPAGR